MFPYCFCLFSAAKLVFSDKRAYVALGTAIVFIILSILPVDKIIDALDFNCLLMLSGTMILVYYFIESKMPAKIADFLLDKSK